MPLLQRATLAALLLCLPRVAGAAPENSSRWIVDPSSGCALFDASLRPGDEVRWDGDCVNGRAEGKGTARFTNNGDEFERFTGSFKGGVAENGPVTVSWGEGWSYDGAMVAGHFEGHGILTNDKKDRFEGDWKSGKLNGQGSVTHDDGSHYDGAWKNDLPNGHGILTRADGSKLEGDFLDGKYVQDAAQADAPAPTPVAIEKKATVEPPTSALAGMSGKKLLAVDGATLNLIAIEGGIERDITSAAGQLQKSTFIFINDKLGTVAADGDPATSASANVTGFFRLTDNGVEIRYADGRAETLASLDDGVLMKQTAPGAADICRAYFPDGHAFSDAEKKAAVAEYAVRLGLAPPETKAPCPGDVAVSAAPSAAPEKPKPRAEAAKPAVKLAPASLKNKSKGMLGSLEAVAVKESVVHAIDPIPMPALPSAEGVTDVTPAIAGPAAGVPGPQDASACLKVESDGSHWGFRNSCAYDVQFSYCLAAGGNNLTDCSAGGVTGSVAAKSFGALLPDTSFSEADAEHDFRWLACNGGAGEVVAHLERSDPPAGRCVRAGDVASK